LQRILFMIRFAGKTDTGHGWQYVAADRALSGDPEGPARSRGLDLTAAQRKPAAAGVNKPPVAAGIGSGGRDYDIIPGQPDRSIRVYRIASAHPGVMMTEPGKRLVREVGVVLIRRWIAAMPDPSREAARDPR
jgi:hypothetical protein